MCGSLARLNPEGLLLGPALKHHYRRALEVPELHLQGLEVSRQLGAPWCFKRHPDDVCSKSERVMPRPRVGHVLPVVTQIGSNTTATGPLLQQLTGETLSGEETVRCGVMQ